MSGEEDQEEGDDNHRGQEWHGAAKDRFQRRLPLHAADDVQATL